MPSHSKANAKSTNIEAMGNEDMSLLNRSKKRFIHRRGKEINCTSNLHISFACLRTRIICIAVSYSQLIKL